MATHSAGEPVLRPATSDALAADRDAQRAMERRATEAELAQASLADGELRLSAFEAELESTPRLRRGARAELRAAIDQQHQVIVGWEERTLDLEHPVPPITQTGPEVPHFADELEPLGPPTPALDQTADLDLGP